ncbi:MAG TPA: protein kinase [Thermoanaerobaculia bacterium]|nr:protein kinase [Thermoanaerobaculia bacterium]
MDRLIGVGGMGEVYLAEDSTLHRKVALKLLPARFTQDQERVRRFQREARTASALNHPNIITIYEIGEADSVHFIATEYIEGDTLRSRIAKGPMPIGEVVEVAFGVTSALMAAHEAGIVHRDIKPDNIMMRRDGYVKVLDFGLAKLTDESGTPAAESAPGSLVGTLLYVSPEQARGHVPDARADLFSLGTVIYEMLTGTTPFAGLNLLDVVYSIASKDPDPPSVVTGADIPPELDRIVMKALQKDPRDRYQTAREMLQDLKTLRQELEFENKLLSHDSPRRYTPVPLAQAPTMRMTFPPSDALKKPGRTIGSPVVMVGALMLLIVAALYAFVRFGPFAEGTTIDSVAVLPFANGSGDPNSEYLSDGITESVIDSLSQLPHLQVIARSTVFRYKGKNADPLRVGHELKVRGVVTGQLIQRGDTLVIRAALTDVKKGTQIWGEQYNRKLSDVLAVQQEMSQEISDKLRRQLSGEEKKLLTRRDAENSEAFQLYLKGRYYRQRLNEPSIRKAIESYNAAIEKDPTYALAYAGLADAWYGLSNLYVAPREAMPRAREAARRAVAIDESLPQGHTSLAVVKVWYDWDFKGGEREFRRALALNPNDAEAHRLFGDYLTAIGRFDDAIHEKIIARQLDPLSLPVSYDVARTYFYAGRLNEARAEIQKTIDLDDRWPYSYWLVAQIEMTEGNKDQAIASLKKALDIGGRTPLFLATWGYVNARVGDKEEATKAMEELRSRSGGYTLPLFLARIETGLGDDTEALAQLEKAYIDRSESLVWLKVDPSFERLRRNPGYVALLKRVGLM